MTMITTSPVDLGGKPQESILVFAGATVSGPRGPVFGPLDATSTAPITLVCGNRGSGRTSLLLAAAGRMRLDKGTITVLGHDARRQPRALRRVTGIAGFDAIDLLEPQATVAESIRERMTWISPWHRRVPRLSASDVTTALEPVCGPLDVPPHDRLIRDLSEADELLLRIALALLERPQMVLIDDLDGVKDPAERRRVAHRIETLAAEGMCFVVGSADPADATLFPADSVAIVAIGH